MRTVKYLVPVKWHITVFPSPLLQVCGLESVTCCHMHGSVDGIVDIIGAVQDKECHQDEDGCKDHHPGALLALQCKQLLKQILNHLM